MSQGLLDRIGASQSLSAIVIIVFSALAAVVYWDGVGANDSGRYINVAHRWLEEGAILPETHWGLRHLLVLPLSFSFAVFGSSELTSAAPNAAYAAALIALTFHFVRKTLGPVAALACALLIGCSVFFLDAQLEVSAHGATAFFTAAAFWIFHAALTSTRPLALAALAGVVGAFAWLCNEAAAFIPATFLLYAFFFARKHWIGIASAAAFASVILIEMAAYAAAAGDPFYRYLVDLGHGGDKGIRELARLDLAVWLKRPIMSVLSDPTTTPFLLMAAMVLLLPGFRAFAVGEQRRAIFALFGLGALVSFVLSAYALNLRQPHYYPILSYVTFITLAAFIAWLAGANRGTLAALAFAGLFALNLVIGDYRKFGVQYAPRALAKHILATGDVVFTDPKTAGRTRTLLRLGGLSETETFAHARALKSDFSEICGLVMLKLDGAAKPRPGWKEILQIPERRLPWTHALLKAAGADEWGPAPIRYALSYNKPYALFETPPCALLQAA